MLVVRDLVVRFDDWLGHYDLTVPRGAMAALVGPSGGGKSTLLNAIAGFERPQSGTLTFDGVDLMRLKPAARPVAIVFQDHNLLPNLTAAQNAGLALSPALRLSARDRALIDAALARVGLADKGGRRPAELSGGQRQRVALARAMLTRRPLLLLDEPLSGLDPTLRRDMVALFDAIRRETGLTVVLTTHTPEDVADHVDAIMTVAEGRIRAERDATATAAGPGLSPRRSLL